MKKACLAMALLAAVLLSAAAGARNNNVEAQCCVVRGVGRPPAGMNNPGRAAAMAERAAKVAAMKNLLACMARRGWVPPGDANVNEGRLPPWVRVGGAVRNADGSVQVALGYCP